MKDKLKKNGHKKGYYVFQSFIKTFLAAVCLLVVAAVPVGIAYRISVYEETSKHVMPKEEVIDEAVTDIASPTF
ncbi:MAG: hypothetical protein MJ228_04340 [Bacilli bacterium]|nr:hypothetical protein [Bacilli bacterium]